MAEGQRTAERDWHSANTSGVLTASAADHERAYYFYYYVGFTPTFVMPRAQRRRRMT
jgi:hypothetical protein